MEDAHAQEEPIQVKVVVLGDMFVGKTSLCKQFVSHTFDFNTESTVRIAFQSKNLDLDGEKVTLRIWDTAGQEKYRSLAPIYYKGADVAIVAYDVNRKESFETLKFWIEELKKNTDERLCVAVAGNKCDDAKSREVPTSAGKELADSYGALFAETSARTGTNVNQLFIEATKMGVQFRKAKEEERRLESLVLSPSQPPAQSKCDC